MRRRQFFIVNVVMVMMLFGISLAAQPFMGKPGEDGGRGNPHMKPSPTHIYMMLKAKQKELNITDTQLEQIKNKAFTLEEKIISLEGKNRLLHLELQKLLLEEKAKDYNKIGDVLTKVSANRQVIFIENLKTMDAIHGLLTPEQQEAIKEAMKKRFDKPPFPGKGMKGRLPGRFLPPDENPPGENPHGEVPPGDADFQQE